MKNKKKLTPEQERELQLKKAAALENAKVIQAATINGVEIKALVYRSVENAPDFVAALTCSDDVCVVAQADSLETLEEAMSAATAMFLKFLPSIEQRLRSALKSE